MSHSKRFALTVGLISAILIAPLTSAAQNSSSTSDWSAVRNVSVDSNVSVKLKTGKTVDGKLLSVTDSSITLSRKNTSTEIKREEVKSVYQVIKKSATSGALIGLGGGCRCGRWFGSNRRQQR